MYSQSKGASRVGVRYSLTDGGRHRRATDTVLLVVAVAYFHSITHRRRSRVVGGSPEPFGGVPERRHNNPDPVAPNAGSETVLIGLHV